jgi:predicted enzyme related to lactoylglutathione lyase
MGNEVMTGIPVSDFKPAADFYERLLGRAPDFVAIEGREVLWQVRDVAWIYVVLDQQRAGSALMAWLVDDLDAMLAQLAARGIEAGEPVREGGGRKATVTDPDGNSIAFVQVP